MYSKDLIERLLHWSFAPPQIWTSGALGLALKGRVQLMAKINSSFISTLKDSPMKFCFVTDLEILRRYHILRLLRLCVNAYIHKNDLFDALHRRPGHTAHPCQRWGAAALPHAAEESAGLNVAPPLLHRQWLLCLR